MRRRTWSRHWLAATLVCVPLLAGCISRAAPTPIALPGSGAPGASDPGTSASPSGDVASPGASGGAGGASAIFARVSPSVLFVGTPIGAGSGIVVSERHVLTNAHVVRPFSEARLVDVDGTELGNGRVVGWDLLADIAVLETARRMEAPAITTGDPARLQIGDPVFLVGFPDANPAGPRARITEGIITGDPLEWHDGLTYLESDAETARGQSGGAMVDARGELLGLTGGERGALAVSLDARDALERATRILQGDDVDGLDDRLLPAPVGEGELEVTARIQSRADAHAWVVTGRQGDPAGRISLTADAGDVGLYALAAGGELTNSAGDPGRSLVVALDFAPPGPYLVKVESTVAFPVEVRLRSTLGLTPVADPDDGPAMRAGDRHLGVADYAGDLDWFTITLDAGERVRIRASAAGFDPALYLDDVATGETLIAGSDSGGPLGIDDEVRFQAPRAGDYRIVMHDSRFFGFGGYRLDVLPG